MELNQQKCQRCGEPTLNEKAICGPCQSYIKSYPDCKYYKNVEKRTTVPYCTHEEHDCEILGIDGSYFCHKCELKEAEAWPIKASKKS